MKDKYRKIGLFILIIVSILLAFNSFKNANEVIVSDANDLINSHNNIQFDEDFNIVQNTINNKLTQHTQQNITRLELQKIIFEIIGGMFYLFVSIIFYIELALISKKEND